ncbi:hypothetical protein BDW74DRAFT_32939 [Aspergillus multicolor]|uniref:uncharacterized protein n=1 Tax=Aspergillus multicolor TaxID=41759 RepID=UPI003CCD7053
MLLDAGADPTLRGEGCFFLRMLSRIHYGPNINVHTLLSLILCHSSDYLVTRERDSLGRTLLLQYCADNGEVYSGPSRRAVKALLQLGSTLHDRDHELNTCLHILLEHFPQILSGYSKEKYTNIAIQRFINTMIYMLRRGADINAVNKNGETPGDVVDHMLDFPLSKWSVKFKSVLDVWNAVLHGYYDGTANEESSEDDEDYEGDEGGVALPKEE